MSTNEYKSKDIVLVMGGQFSNKVVLKSLSTKPQVDNSHAAGEREVNQKHRNCENVKKKKVCSLLNVPYNKNDKRQRCQKLKPEIL